MTFSGFPKETQKFLAGLAKNNDKKWFDAHRSDYDMFYIEPAKAFVEAMGHKLQQIAPGVTAEPRVNGSIFRINRDIRFSKDKTPYKPHLDLWFWHGKDKKAQNSGFFFRMFSDRVIVGAGIHGFEEARLAKFRKAVDADTSGKALAQLVGKLRKAGCGLPEPKYKRVPSGFDADHARAELLKYDAMFATIEAPLPPDAASKKFVTWCTTRFKKVAPMHAWLVDNV